MLAFRGLPGRGRDHLLLLAASMAAMIVADLLFAVQTLHKTYFSGSWPDLLWVGAWCLGGLAGLRAAEMPDQAPDPHQPSERTTTWAPRLSFLGIALALGLLAWRIYHPSTVSMGVLLLGVTVMVFTVLLRESLLRQENRRLLSAGQQEAAQRQQAEAAEQEQRQVTEALRDSMAALSGNLDQAQVIRRILVNVKRLVPSDSAALLLVDDGQARVAGYVGYMGPMPEDQVLGRRLSVTAHSDLRRMALTGQPIVIADTHRDADWVRHPERDWIRSNAAAPIRLHGEVIGFLELDSRTPG